MQVMLNGCVGKWEERIYYDSTVEMWISWGIAAYVFLYIRMNIFNSSNKSDQYHNSEEGFRYQDILIFNWTLIKTK